MNAKDIVNLLAERHIDDVFVRECKNGSTWGTTNTHMRLDAWAMKKSWAHPLVTGYEVKVNRSDFVNDKKWREYLPYCNEFYFVCPHGLINKTELPEEAGLMYVAKTLNGIRIVKKPPHRHIVVPESLYRYILMNRVKIKDESSFNNGNNNMNNGNKKEFWERWLAEKDENKRFSQLVIYNIKKCLTDKYLAIIKENDEVKRQNEDLTNIKNRLTEMGVNINESYWTWGVKNKLDAFNNSFPLWITRDIKRLSKSLSSFVNNIEEHKKLLGASKDPDIMEIPLDKK